MEDGSRPGSHPSPMATCTLATPRPSSLTSASRRTSAASATCVWTTPTPHGQSDAIEGVTHSLCSLEFNSHRPLYDWFLAHVPLDAPAPKQREFARLELTHTITSKRRLRSLVTDGVVDGWDDPRMPTLRGMRRRGYPAAAIRAFCQAVGTTKNNSVKAIEEFESFVRRELNATTQRRMAVLHPLKLVLDGWPTDENGNPVVEWFELVNNPENPRLPRGPAPQVLPPLPRS